jgi:hypothetical protein
MLARLGGRRWPLSWRGSCSRADAEGRRTTSGQVAGMSRLLLAPAHPRTHPTRAGQIRLKPTRSTHSTSLVIRWSCRGVEEVGFEPAVSLHHSPRSGPGRCGDLRFPRTGRDRSCPTGTAASRCCADPARTSATSTRLGPVPSGRGRLRRSGPPRPGTGSAGPGTARSITASTLSLPFVLVPFDRGSGAGQSDVSHRE